MNCKYLLTVVLLSLGLLMAAGTAQAGLITNGGFESPAVSNTGGIPSPWTAYGQDLAGEIWTANMNGSWNGGRLAVAPSSPTGEVNAVYIQTEGQGHATPTLHPGVYQELSAIAPNTLYTLTLDVGGVKTPQPYPYMAPTVELGTGSTPETNLLTVASSSTPAVVPAASSGDWKTWTFTYQTGATVPSANLRVDIHMPANGDYYLAAVDNVSLTATASPEPSTMVLLASGLIGLLCYAWRKRK